MTYFNSDILVEPINELAAFYRKSVSNISSNRRKLYGAMLSSLLVFAAGCVPSNSLPAPPANPKTDSGQTISALSFEDDKAESKLLRDHLRRVKEERRLAEYREYLKTIPATTIVYHHVVKSKSEVSNPDYFVTIDSLRAQLSSLKKLGAKFITMSQYIDFVVHGELDSFGYDFDNPRPKILVVASWDDNWKDEENAIDVLNELQIPGNFYLNTGLTDGKYYMSCQDINALPSKANVPIEFGYHSSRHINYRTSSKEAREKDLANNNKEMEACLAGFKAIKAFALPFGESSPESVIQLKDSGMEDVRSISWGLSWFNSKRNPQDREPAFMMTDYYTGEHIFHIIMNSK